MLKTQSPLKKGQVLIDLSGTIYSVVAAIPGSAFTDVISDCCVLL